MCILVHTHCPCSNEEVEMGTFVCISIKTKTTTYVNIFTVQAKKKQQKNPKLIKIQMQELSSDYMRATQVTHLQDTLGLTLKRQEAAYLLMLPVVCCYAHRIKSKKRNCCPCSCVAFTWLQLGLPALQALATPTWESCLSGM